MDADLHVVLRHVTRIETRVLQGGTVRNPSRWRVLRITCGSGETYEIECNALGAHTEYLEITERDGRPARIAKEG